VGLPESQDSGSPEMHWLAVDFRLARQGFRRDNDRRSPKRMNERPAPL